MDDSFGNRRGRTEQRTPRHGPASGRTADRGTRGRSAATPASGAALLSATKFGRDDVSLTSGFRARSSSPEGLQDADFVPVHPSHRGTFYKRKPKKKKKKRKIRKERSKSPEGAGFYAQQTQFEEASEEDQYYGDGYSHRAGAAGRRNERAGSGVLLGSDNGSS